MALDRDTAEKYGRVLLEIRDDYFDAMNPDDPNAWLPNEKARKLTQEMEKAQKK